MLFFKRSKPKNLSDAELVISYQQSQNQEVLGELYERYLSLLYGLCLKYLKDREDAKDMVMHIFERLSQKLPQQTPIENFKSWLYTFARNECLMALRKDKKMIYQDFFAENEEESMEKSLPLHLDNESPDEKEKNLQLLEKGLDFLDEEQKICLKLFYLEKKSYQEITEITSYELGKVKSYIQNGKRNLKIFMEKNASNGNMWLGALLVLLEKGGIL
jgi:RNA polymerase sigma-70 factor (ECF subfamily)